MDVALHKLPVTVVLDRSGVTGSDGASHNCCGTSRCSASCRACGLPRRATRLREELGEALDVRDRPTAIRFRKGDVGKDILAIKRRGVVEVLAAPGLSDDVLLVAVGAFPTTALAVAELLRKPGRRCDGHRPTLGAGSGVDRGVGAVAQAAGPSRTTACTVGSAHRCRRHCAAPRLTVKAKTRQCEPVRGAHLGVRKVD
jgi:hypothetical protein